MQQNLTPASQRKQVGENQPLLSHAHSYSSGSGGSGNAYASHAAGVGMSPGPGAQYNYNGYGGVPTMEKRNSTGSITHSNSLSGGMWSGGKITSLK
jgi:hypothetical protein